MTVSNDTLSNKESLAQKCIARMYSQDKASQHLAMVIEDVGVGQATVRMTITEQMVNGHGTCHGGYIFTLADSAFAFACNSYNQNTVAQHCAITFIAPGVLGQTLYAICQEQQRRGRSGIYDVSIQLADGTVIAEFRGLSRTLSGQILAETDAE